MKLSDIIIICYRPSVRLSVCPSHGWISQRRSKFGPTKSLENAFIVHKCRTQINFFLNISGPVEPLDTTDGTPVEKHWTGLLLRWEHSLSICSIKTAQSIHVMYHKLATTQDTVTKFASRSTTNTVSRNNVCKQPNATFPSSCQLITLVTQVLWDQDKTKCTL